MHQHKTVAQVFLILSIVNFVLAAPAVQEIHEARDNVMVRVLPEGVAAVSDYDEYEFTSGSSHSYPSIPNSPSHISSTESESDGSSRFSSIGPESDGFSRSSSIRPESDGSSHSSPIRPVSDGSSHSLSEPASGWSAVFSDGPPPSGPPAPPPAPSRKTSSKPKIWTPEKAKAVKKVAAVGAIAITLLGIVDLHVLAQDKSDS